MKPLENKQEEAIASGIIAPQILVDPTEIKSNNGRVVIDKALLIVREQMRLSGMRKATIREYNYIFNRAVKKMDLKFLDEVTLEVIFEWLSSLGDVSNVTKQSRLRVLKAVINRFYDNGWYEKKFWKDIKVRVDTKIKPPADEKQLSILLSLLDMTNFIQYRDTVAILTMYKTGIRMNTLIQLEEKHIDFDTNTLLLSGDIMKNHDVLKLPFDDELAGYFKRLIEQNNVIRKHYRKRKKIIFLSKFGDSLDVEVMPETFGKRHDNVLRDIEALKKDVLNFEEMFFEAETADNYGRPRRTFIINRDGFTLLAMGFRGEKAMQFKLKYIEQLNLMENQLKS